MISVEVEHIGSFVDLIVSGEVIEIFHEKMNVEPVYKARVNVEAGHNEGFASNFEIIRQDMPQVEEIDVVPKT
ncbi:hypothetical protein L2E82_37622 [Cichorium intybus]|uniref:Uncharacterized protein n=1 Tax=Cichorium intybus TaxID=13427 RepID=A0ACB9AE84_CICIN|nr:hypothetical protein L2E82_37622 [Cichorium intybus]